MESLRHRRNVAARKDALDQGAILRRYLLRRSHRVLFAELRSPQLVGRLALQAASAQAGEPRPVKRAGCEPSRVNRLAIRAQQRGERGVWFRVKVGETLKQGPHNRARRPPLSPGNAVQVDAVLFGQFVNILTAATLPDQRGSGLRRGMRYDCHE